MLTIVVGLLLSAASQEHRYVGESWTCQFPKTGTVIIDTREPGASLTIRGKKRRAYHGSDFYYPADDPNETLIFGPNMSWWEFAYTGERASKCTRRKNAR